MRKCKMCFKRMSKKMRSHAIYCSRDCKERSFDMRRHKSTGSFCREIVVGLLGGKCKRCGTTNRLELDHVTPVSKGGESTLDNLQLLCNSCHKEKGKEDQKK